MASRKRYNTQISFPLEVEDKNKLEKIADEQGTNVSQLARQAIKKLLNDEENEKTRSVKTSAK